MSDCESDCESDCASHGLQRCCQMQACGCATREEETNQLREREVLGKQDQKLSQALEALAIAISESAAPHHYSHLLLATNSEALEAEDSSIPGSQSPPDSKAL